MRVDGIGSPSEVRMGSAGARPAHLGVDPENDVRWFEEDPARIKGPEEKARLRFLAVHNPRLAARVKAVLRSAPTPGDTP